MLFRCRKNTAEELLEMAKQILSSNSQEKPDEIVGSFLRQQKCAPHLCTTASFFKLIKDLKKADTLNSKNEVLSFN